MRAKRPGCFPHAMAANGGLITLEDLKAYKAVERQPLTGTVQGLRAHNRSASEFRRNRHAADARSAGRVRIRERRLGRGGDDSLSLRKRCGGIMRDRSEYLGDPDFTKVPVRALLNPEYIKKLRGIHRSGPCEQQRHRSGRDRSKAYESSETTHFPSWTKREMRSA